MSNVRARELPLASPIHIEFILCYAAMLIYLALSLCIGVTCGTVLAYLLRMKEVGSLAAKQWLAYGAAIFIVLGCAAGIGKINTSEPVSESLKFASAFMIALGFFAGYRWKRRIK